MMTATQCREDVLDVIRRNPGIRFRRLIRTVGWAESDVQDALESLLWKGRIDARPVSPNANRAKQVAYYAL